MSRIFFLLVLGSFLVGSIYSCTHKTETPQPSNNTNTGGNNSGNSGGNNGGNNAGGSGEDTSICFERDVLPIFVSNCASKIGCHDDSSHMDGFVFTSWATITSKEFKPGDLDDTEIYERITEDDPDKIMPPPPNAPLTSRQIGIIREWILRGAPNSSNCPPKGCDSNKYAFASTIKPILDNYCKGCHNNSNMSGGYSYETHSGVVAAVQSGRFLGAIKHQAGFSPMPKGSNRLSDCQIIQIEKWITTGMLNN